MTVTHGRSRAVAADFEQWRRIVSDSFVPLEVEPAPGAPTDSFTGSVELTTIAGLGLSTVTAQPHTVRRTPELVREGGGLFKLSLQLTGTGTLVQDGREVVLEPGRLALYDTSRPYTLSFAEDFTTHVMMFPHASFGVSPEEAGRLTATALDADHRLGAAVTAFLRQAVDVAPQLQPDVAARLAGNVVDLLGTLVSEVLGGAPPAPVPMEAVAAEQAATEPGGRAAGRAGQRALVEAYVEEHLADPGLTPASVAAAHYMSVRSLHLLFEGSGTTVAALIRERRLEHCRAELADAAHAGRPVAVVGARWGFTDPAHFSRAFRARYGVAPGRFRREAA